MTENYHIWTVSPAGYLHSRCFEEVKDCLRSALEDGLDFSCTAGNFPFPTRTNIVLGANLLPYSQDVLPERYVIYNLEQITRKSPWLTAQYLDFLKEASLSQRVWDYSLSNIDALERLGIKAAHLPVGCMPCLTRIENVANPDIDVLHYGSMNDRRHRVLQELINRGIKVRHAFNEYGTGRDALISRAKIVLNVHYYESKVFEIVRCSYLMANRKCIVSETGEDISLEEPFHDALAFSDYDGLVDTCMELLADPGRRETLAARVYEVMSRRSQADYLKEVL